MSARRGEVRSITTTVRAVAYAARREDQEA